MGSAGAAATDSCRRGWAVGRDRGLERVFVGELGEGALQELRGQSSVMTLMCLTCVRNSVR